MWKTMAADEAHGGRYNPRSRLNRLNDNWDHLLVHEGQPWLPAHDDALLECYLVRKFVAFVGEHDSYARELGRSFRAVETRIWKVIARYDGIDYRPGPGRTRRVGLPFTVRDRAVFFALFNDGPKANGALDCAHLPNLLARDVGEVEQWAAGLAGRRAGFAYRVRDKDETLWDWACRVISSSLGAGRGRGFDMGAS